MSQLVAVIFASSVLLALAIALRAMRVGRSAIAVAALAVAVAAVPRLWWARIDLWNGLRAPFVPVLAIAALHMCITPVLWVRMRRLSVAPIDCPRCGHASPKQADGTPLPHLPSACPECGVVAAEWTALVAKRRTQRTWRYRCAVHAVLGGFLFAMLAAFFVPLQRYPSEAPYRDLLISDGVVELLDDPRGEGPVRVSTGMIMYRSNFLHVLGDEDERSILVATDFRAMPRQIAVLRNGIAPAEALERVAEALSKGGLDAALAGAVLDAAVVAVSANNDGERITLAPLHVGRWYIDLVQTEEELRRVPAAPNMPGWQWILALLALAGAWAMQPPPLLTSPAARHRPDRSQA